MEGYTIPEVAERLGVPARDIREWIENGRLHAVRVRLAEVEKRLQELEREDPQARPPSMRPALAPLFREGSPPHGERV